MKFTHGFQRISTGNLFMPTPDFLQTRITLLLREYGLTEEEAKNFAHEVMDLLKEGVRYGNNSKTITTSSTRNGLV